ncbi:TIGR00730 family Rossman fold protein [bacterium]|nr:TIGR00730 family Rossman fold protein [bacterium]
MSLHPGGEGDGDHAAPPRVPKPKVPVTRIGDGGRDERSFLEGPATRVEELRRATAIFFEFMRGFRHMHFIGPCVTVFGSARFPDFHPYYALARELGAHLARDGFTVMTGGGPGIMEAANRGAHEAGGYTVGCNIVLPEEQAPNPYLDKMIEFDHFYVRKVMLVKYSYAFVIMPGGFGTMDETYELLTLIQTGKVTRKPVVVMGTDFYGPMVEWLREKMLREGTIGEADLDLILLTDSASEAAQVVYENAQAPLGRRPDFVDRPRWILGERSGGKS